MDLVAGVRRVIVLMEHVEKGGEPKFKRRCTLPLTGAAVVDLLITDLAVFGIERGGGATLLEMAPGTSLEEIRAKTEAGFR